jgi:hypothetical protein
MSILLGPVDAIDAKQITKQSIRFEIKACHQKVFTSQINKPLSITQLYQDARISILDRERV